MASTDSTDNFTTEDQSNGGKEAISDEDKVILSLPREIGWLNQNTYLFEGFWYESFVMSPIISFQKHFQAKDSDVVVASLPKTGTTWLKALAFAIVNRHRFSSFENHPLQTHNSHELVPFFEFDIYVEKNPSIHLENMTEPRLFGTHISFSSLVKSVKESDCKIIYICRNPFDTFVSTWFFMNKLRLNKCLPVLTIEEGFEKFCKGISPSGPFWDHMLGYLNESIARPHKVLFLKYEDLKEDVSFHVKRIANFLGCPFTQEEESTREIENIINLCGFEKMKELEVNKSGNVGWKVKIEKNDFFRKANIGDWTNYFSLPMEEKLSKIIEDKFGGSTLSFKVRP